MGFVGIFITVIALLLFGAMTIVAFESDYQTVRFRVKIIIRDPKDPKGKIIKVYSRYLRWEIPCYEEAIEDWAKIMVPQFIPKNVIPSSPEPPTIRIWREGGKPLQSWKRIRRGAGFIIDVFP